MNMRKLSALGLAVACAAGILSGCSANGANSADQVHAIDSPMPQAPEELGVFYRQGVTWKECSEDGLQCGEYKVPLNYSDPAGSVMHIAAMKRPASGERIGSLLVNPGGPGGEGKSMASMVEAMFPPSILDHFDIIGFDPRGVGSSDPVDCVDDDELYDLLSASFPNTAEGDKASQEDALSFIDGCKAQSAQLLPYIGTENAARDMDVIRAVEGDPKLYYVGFSYGTELGAQYAELFPKNVGRLVLDGAVASQANNFEQTKDQLVAFENALNAYLDTCLSEKGKACPFTGTREDARSTIISLLDQALKKPFPTGDPDEPLTQAGLLYGIITPLYSSDDQAYRTLNQAFTALIEEKDGGAFHALFNSYLEREDKKFTNNSMEANISITCADTKPEGDSTVWKKQEEELADVAPVFGSAYGYDELMCSAWPYHPEKSVGNFTAQGSDPIVVVGTKGDPATPYKWAQDLADSLANASLLTWEGKGHTAFGRSTACVDDALSAYLLAGVVPKDGLTCPAQ